MLLDGAVVLVDDVVGVVVLLGALLPPPPQPTVKTSMAAPPKTAKAVLASVLIGLPLSCQGVSRHTPTRGRANGSIRVHISRRNGSRPRPVRSLD
jgi:hypothetical protein